MQHTTTVTCMHLLNAATPNADPESLKDPERGTLFMPCLQELAALGGRCNREGLACILSTTQEALCGASHTVCRILQQCAPSGLYHTATSAGIVAARGASRASPTNCVMVVAASVASVVAIDIAGIGRGRWGRWRGRRRAANKGTADGRG